MVINGAMNGDLFLAYVQQQLVPTIHRGDTVVMDDLCSHKKPGVREAIEKAGATMAYPAASPPRISTPSNWSSPN